MKGKITIGIALLLVLAMQPIYATNQDLTTDVPIPEDYDGTIYGIRYGQGEAGGGSTSESEEEDESEEIILNIPVSGWNTANSSDNEQGATGESVTSIPTTGVSSDGTKYFVWQSKEASLELYEPLLKFVKEKDKNFIVQIIDKDEKIYYRLRVPKESFTHYKSKDITVNFKTECSHEDAISKLYPEEKTLKVLMCEEDSPEMAMYIAFPAETSWKRENAIYQYSYDNNQLVFVSNDLAIDSDGLVELALDGGKDYVLSEGTLPKETKSVITFVAGLQGDSGIVNSTMAWFSIGCLIGIILLTIGLYLVLRSPNGRTNRR